VAIFRQLPFEFMDPHQCLASLLQRFCFKLSDPFLCYHGFIVAATTIPLELRIASWVILLCSLQTPLFLRLCAGLSSKAATPLISSGAGEKNGLR
jgi:hypothetical protein